MVRDWLLSLIHIYTDDYGKLTSRAVEAGMDKFLNTMQEKLMDIAENGQSIAVTVGIDEASSRSMSQEVGADGLASVSYTHLDVYKRQTALIPSFG